MNCTMCPGEPGRELPNLPPAKAGAGQRVMERTGAMEPRKGSRSGDL
jgi:hypothetical protein